MQDMICETVLDGFAVNIAVQAPKSRVLKIDRFAHASKLLGMTIA